jgi:hypothetical protein
MKSETINLSAALSIFEDQLTDIRKACVENYHVIQLIPHKELDIDGDCTKDDIHLAVEHNKVQKLSAPIKQVIKRIDARKRHYTKETITEVMIERAREYPIADLYQMLTSERVGHGNVSCPFHDDNKPSMSLKKNNRYKCFSCDAGGDTIDMYMKVNGVNFLEAVRALQ